VEVKLILDTSTSSSRNFIFFLSFMVFSLLLSFPYHESFIY
jgi:hypothetical protein